MFLAILVEVDVDGILQVAGYLQCGGCVLSLSLMHLLFQSRRQTQLLKVSILNRGDEEKVENEAGEEWARNV